MYPYSQEQHDAVMTGAVRRKAALANGARKASRAGLLRGKAKKLAAINEYACYIADLEMGSF